MGSIFTRREILGERDVRVRANTGTEGLGRESMGLVLEQRGNSGTREIWGILRCELDLRVHITPIFWRE
jgi:hypothetical protein